MENLKYCTKCERPLPLSAFAKNKRMPDGLQFNCRGCCSLVVAAWREKNIELKRENDRKYAREHAEAARAKAKAWALANPERKRERDAAYRLENRDKVREIQTAYRKENAEKIRAGKKAYSITNRQKIKEQRVAAYYANAEANRAAAREWAAKNPERRRAQHAARKAAKIKATPKWANREKMQEFYSYAVFLTETTGVEHHVDHVVPLRSSKVCGLHCEFNLQVLTATENMRKRNNFESE